MVEKEKDIVERLRGEEGNHPATAAIAYEAAYEIERERKAHMETCVGLHDAQKEIERLQSLCKLALDRSMVGNWDGARSALQYALGQERGEAWKEHAQAIGKAISKGRE